LKKPKHAVVGKTITMGWVCNLMLDAGILLKEAMCWKWSHWGIWND